MRTVRRTLLVGLAVTVVLMSIQPCQAKQEKGGGHKMRRAEHGPMQLTPEAIERMLKRMSQTEPGQAEKLRELQKENPEQ